MLIKFLQSICRKIAGTDKVPLPIQQGYTHEMEYHEIGGHTHIRWKTMHDPRTIGILGPQGEPTKPVEKFDKLRELLNTPPVWDLYENRDEQADKYEFELHKRLIEYSCWCDRLENILKCL